MKRILMLVAVCAAVTSAFAGVNTTWTGKGADNKWSTPENWDLGVPDAEKSDKAVFNPGDWTVEIDGADSGTTHYFQVILKAGAGKVTLTGSAALYFGSAGGSTRMIEIRAGRELVIDGPTVSPWSYEQSGKVTILSGCLEGAGKGHHLSDGAEMVVAGGTFDCDGSFSMSNGASRVTMTSGSMKLGYGTSSSISATVGAESSFRILGGDLTVRPSKFIVEEGADFAILGGTTIHLTEAITDTTADFWLPRKGIVLDVLSGATTAVNLKTVHTNSYAYGGSLVVTNGGAITFTLNNDNKDLYTFKLGGRGSIVADKIRHFPAKSGGSMTLDLQSLTLGAGGFVSTDNSHNGKFSFVNGVTLGAYGDWAQADYPDKPTSFAFEGPVVFNTRDAFDGETVRTMTLSNVNLEAASSLKAMGGGAVNLRLTAAGSQPQLHALFLVGSTTLSLLQGPGALMADELTVDAGSRLSIAPDRGGRLDAVNAATLAAGSVKLEFSDPAFVTNRCPVYFAPVGTDPDLSMFDTTDVPDGLSLAKRENVVYLTDGSPDVNDTAGSDYSWTGADGNDFCKAENWSPAGAITSSVSGNRHFNGWKNMVVTNASASARPNRIYIDAGCGPFLMRGSAIRPSTEDSAIISHSSYPAVFEMPIGRPNGNGGFEVCSYGTGYLALTGGGQLSTKDMNTNTFTCAGDVRLGGEWQFKKIVPTIVTDQQRPTRLTLLPGATLTTFRTDMATSIVKPASISVAAGANLTMNNAEVSFSTYANTHFIDGTWTVACPFKATSRQSFRGTGTLKLASLAAAAGGIEIADSLTLVPGDWDAATEVFFRETPTVKTEAAATIGEAVAFELEPHATLTVDTTGGDLTMETPILGGGDIVKTGSGKLILDTADCVIDTLTIAAGEVAPSARLVAEADAGYVPFLTVRKLVGELTVKDAKIRATLNADGTTTYSFKNRHGMVLIVR